MTERDAKDLVDWLDQAEEETKATIAEHERIDPFYDGVLSTVQTVREYIKKMRKVDEAEGGKQMKETIADSKFEYIEEIEPFFWWTGSLNVEQAITHLEKQRQKKIETWNGQASCPRCKKLFGEMKTIRNLTTWEMPYCKFCGQALDWSDEQ